jgi:hypothetical protein
MKQLVTALFIWGALNFANAQMVKSDVQEIFSSVDINDFPRFFITFNTEGGNKHKMEDENLASYEGLDPKTAEFEYKDNYLHLNGKQYDIYIPYNQIKYIHKIKGKSIQIRLSH